MNTNVPGAPASMEQTLLRLREQAVQTEIETGIQRCGLLEQIRQYACFVRMANRVGL
jgi:hypothetical protein